MDVQFRNNILVDLYEGRKVKDNRFKSNPSLVKQFVKTVDKLLAIDCVEELYIIKSLNYEKLIGDRSGQSSVRINDQFRLIFEEIFSETEPIKVIMLAIEDISKHYE